MVRVSATWRRSAVGIDGERAASADPAMQVKRSARSAIGTADEQRGVPMAGSNPAIAILPGGSVGSVAGATIDDRSRDPLSGIGWGADYVEKVKGRLLFHGKLGW